MAPAQGYISQIRPLRKDASHKLFEDKATQGHASIYGEDPYHKVALRVGIKYMPPNKSRLANKSRIANKSLTARAGSWGSVLAPAARRKGSSNKSRRTGLRLRSPGVD